MDELKLYLSVGAIVISLATTVYAWITAKSRVNSEHLKAVDKTLKTNDRRIQKLESEIEHRPGKEDLHEVKLSLSQLEGTVGRFEESLKGVDRTVRRIDEYLMKRDK